MKDGAVIANAGHFDVEVDIGALRDAAKDAPEDVLPLVQRYELPGRRLNLLAGGRVVNLAAAQGHPAEVMDISFALQALAIEWLATRADGLEPGGRAGTGGDRPRGRAPQARVARRGDRRAHRRAARVPVQLAALD